MLDARSHQGKFGEDYVRALASATGLLVYHFDLDRDGVDLGLRLPGRVERAASPSIEIQVKTWSRPRHDGSATVWCYDGLTEHQFNRLAGDAYAVPRYLVLVLVPASPREYASAGPDGLLLRHLGYYRSLRDEPPVERPTSHRRRRVDVPTSNVLTAGTLRALAGHQLTR